MVHRCIVCKRLYTKTNPAISFHRFRSEWATMFENVPTTAHICSAHFCEADFLVKPSGIKYLKKGVMPADITIVKEEPALPIPERESPQPSTSADVMDISSSIASQDVKTESIYSSTESLVASHDSSATITATEVGSSSSSTLSDTEVDPLMDEGKEETTAEAEPEVKDIQITLSDTEVYPWMDEGKEETTAEAEPEVEDIQITLSDTEVDPWMDEGKEETTAEAEPEVEDIQIKLSDTEVDPWMDEGKEETTAEAEPEVEDIQIIVEPKRVRCRRTYLGNYSTSEMDRAKQTIIIQKRKMKNLQQDNRRLRARIYNLKALLSHLMEVLYQKGPNT